MRLILEKILLLFMGISFSAFGNFPSVSQVCLELYRLTKDNEDRVSLNEEKRRKWVKAQPVVFQPFMDSISSQIQIITRKDFFRALDECFRKFLETLKPNEKVLFVYDDSYNEFKGGQWVVGHLLNRLPEGRRSFDVERSFLPRISAKTDKNTRIVYIDDALFSGSNAHGSLKSIIDGGIPYSTLEILVPFATNSARRLIEELPNVVSHYNRELRTLREKWQTTNIAIPKAFEPKWFDWSFEFLDHKLPDFLSFLPFLHFGNILSQDGTSFSNTTISFFDSIVPPYKQINRLEIDPERKAVLDSLNSK